MPTVTAVRHSGRQGRKRQQEQKLQAIVARHGDSPLARALAARLRRKPSAASSDSSFGHFSHVQQRRIQRDIKQIKQALGALVEKAEADRWLSAPNAMLGGARPLESIRHGRTRQVAELLARLEQGLFV